MTRDLFTALYLQLINIISADCSQKGQITRRITSVYVNGLCSILSQCVSEIPQVPFAFEFECEWPNGYLVTKQSPNYHLSDLEKSVEWPNGNSTTVLFPNRHSGI